MSQNYESLLTEAQNPQSTRLDEMTATEIVDLMNALDIDTVRAVAAAKPEIARAVDAAAQSIQSGGRVIYIGAGTSGRLGVLDASECPPTFGVGESTFIGIIAGGDTALRHSVENAEDDPELGKSAIATLSPTPRDLVIAISASGSAPYCLGALACARASGAKTSAIVCNQPSPMTELADIAIVLITGPEALSGSTRLKAGTATKMVLNMISTGAMALNGKTYQNLMVDVRTTNMKLKDRCVRIVMRAANLIRTDAEAYLSQASGDTKRAILMALAQIDAETAKSALEKSGGRVKAALQSIRQPPF